MGGCKDHLAVIKEWCKLVFLSFVHTYIFCCMCVRVCLMSDGRPKQAWLEPEIA